MTLGDIKVNEDFVNSKLVFMTTGGANARTTFGGKSVAKSYVYWFAGDDPEDGEGWYLEDDEDATSNCIAEPLPYGDGILVSRMASETDAELICSGQVSTTPVTKEFVNSGYTPVGNCCPMTIKLGDITVNDKFVNSKIVFMTTGGANARTTFGGKSVAKSYVYWAADDDPEDGAGWYLEDDEDATINCNDTITFDAGEGFLVSRMASEAGAAITLPKAL